MSRTPRQRTPRQRTPRQGRHPGKRLSPLRVLLGLAVVIIVAAGAIAVPWYLTKENPAIAETAGPQWFGGYFDVTAADVSASPTAGVGNDDTVVLGFIVAASATECAPSWGTYYSLSEAGSQLDLDRRIDGMRRDGSHVAVSFGGALNQELAVVCDTASALTQAYTRVLDRYSITTIDLDLEGEGLEDVEAGARRARAVVALQRQQKASGTALDVWVTLPTTPTGLTDSGVAAVRQLLDAGVELAGVNVMTMDYGVDLGQATMAETSIQALNGVHDQLTSLYRSLRVPLPAAGAWAVMGATPMIGQNDERDEVFTLDDAAALSDFAREKELARISMWSINRDRTCGPNYPDVSIVSDSCSGVAQGGETFAGILSAGYHDAPSDAAATAAATPLPDDPETSPYPIWSPDAAYSHDVRVVWHGYVYAAKWWVSGGPQPDDPTQTADSTSWVLVGPVLREDEPFTLPTVPAGTYQEWQAGEVYQKGARVVVDGVPFEAKWWTQAEDPMEGVTDHDRSPWKLVE
ncbi:chitinase [Microbacterium suwonense]|uniref:Exported chitinase n=1 Tax=Microbacterium suwonense TaxID=683047 RepID=A0ABM8FUB3_9MICO|nr:chitinase [Microbacterium suwonense]BDZ39157.1 exported chitinase [Microbacterium suwonense]